MNKNKKQFDIMTCGDCNYFEFLKNFERNIHKHFGRYPIIYDLGLTETQIKDLNSKIKKTPTPNDYNSKNSLNYIKTTHKPHCVIDTLTSSGKDCLYLDADTILTSPIHPSEFNDADICITPRHPKERKKEYFTNGFINAGFIFFKNTSKTKKLIKLWSKKCQEHDTTDQKALSDILQKHVSILDGPASQSWDTLDVSLLNAEIYNDVSCRTGKIFHFKNAGRTEKALNRYRRFAKIQYFLPSAIRILIHINRKIRLIVWRPKNRN